MGLLSIFQAFIRMIKVESWPSWRQWETAFASLGSGFLLYVCACCTWQITRNPIAANLGKQRGASTRAVLSKQNGVSPGSARGGCCTWTPSVRLRAEGLLSKEVVRANRKHSCLKTGLRDGKGLMAGPGQSWEETLLAWPPLIVPVYARNLDSVASK